MVLQSHCLIRCCHLVSEIHGLIFKLKSAGFRIGSFLSHFASATDGKWSFLPVSVPKRWSLEARYNLCLKAIVRITLSCHVAFWIRAIYKFWTKSLLFYACVKHSSIGLRFVYFLLFVISLMNKMGFLILYYTQTCVLLRKSFLSLRS